MKNITTEIQVVSEQQTAQKRDFILRLLGSLIVNLIEKESFMENLKIPIESKSVTPELDKLVNCILGYYLFLYKIKSNSQVFVKDTLHDLTKYLKESESSPYKTKNYSCYLKY